MKKKFYIFTLLVALPLSFAVACVETQPNDTPTPPNTATNSSTPSTPMNENSSTSTNEIRINCGGTSYTSAQGVVWSEDSGFNSNSTPYQVSQTIAGTTDQSLYQTERYGTDLQYSIPVTNGQYTLKLHFAELYVTQPGERVFHVDVEGKRVLSNFDTVAETGGIHRAVVKTFTVNVNDGQLDIDFPAITTTHWGKVNAIEIVPNSNDAMLFANFKRIA
jgi:hypothetical protein